MFARTRRRVYAHKTAHQLPFKCEQIELDSIEFGPSFGTESDEQLLRISNQPPLLPFSLLNDNDNFVRYTTTTITSQQTLFNAQEGEGKLNLRRLFINWRQFAHSNEE